MTATTTGTTNGTTPIERTPNIGATLAAELRGVGIDSLEALMRVGFWDAWLQLRRVIPSATASRPASRSPAPWLAFAGTTFPRGSAPTSARG